MQRARRAARLSEVAQLAGVSPGLVSRILNQDPALKVREETRNRVLDAVEMLQYTPHASARALRNARTGLLGFALHHMNDPIYAQLVETAQVAAAERGYSVVLLNADELLEGGDAFRALVSGHRVDGLLIQSGFADGSGRLLEIARAVPSIVFNADEMPGLRTVRLDDASAASLATRHLMELGHELIVFVGAEGSTSGRRYRGYAEAMRESGVPAAPMIAGGWEAGSARSAIESYFAGGGVATGLIVATSTSALGVHAGVIASGRSIPQDVSVVGIHDTWFAEHLNPPLTVVELPLPAIGRLAVEQLIAQITEPVDGSAVLAEPAPRLIVRGTTAEVRRRGTAE